MQNTPENDKIIQKQIFTINISGENSIDIHSLSKLLSNIDTLTCLRRNSSICNDNGNSR